MACLGRNNKDHCCYVNGKPCQFLEENTEQGFRWTCGLRRKLGSWDAVLKHRSYQPLKQHFAQWGYDCASYVCYECEQKAKNN